MPLTCTQILYSPYFQDGSPSRSEQTTHSVLAILVTPSVFASLSPPLMPDEKAPHEHVILEFLFKSVFESRFINMKPTGSFESFRMKSQVADFDDVSRCSGIFHPVLFAMSQRTIS